MSQNTHHIFIISRCKGIALRRGGQSPNVGKFVVSRYHLLGYVGLKVELGEEIVCKKVDFYF